MNLKLGIIGFSQGNGHPYSWSAIVNGYSPEHMKDCEFPSIKDYLSKQKWPGAKIHGAEVTHIYTQDKILSQKIASASLIKNIVNDPIEMIGNIDGLLLARDDAENHIAFVKPFLENGIPVYIDKPIALTVKNLEYIYSLEKYNGQIFTCSALRYAKEMKLSDTDRLKLGSICHIQATTPKSWEKYAIHIIEPTLNIIGKSLKITNKISEQFGKDGRKLSLTFENELTVDFFAFGSKISSPISIRVYGENDWKDLFFLDSFSSFKSALKNFILGIKTHTCRSSKKYNKKVVSIIEAGLKQ